MSEPSIQVLIMLGNAVSHAEEAINSGGDGYAFDVAAFKSCISNSELRVWMAEMTDSALISLPRRGNHWRGGSDE